MALAHAGAEAQHEPMTFHWVDGGFFLVALLPLLLWVLLLVLGVILLVRLLNRSGASQPPQWGSGDSAEDVLRRRFATGEIDEEEYRRRLDVLRR